MSRQASCTSLATRSLALSLVPLIGAKSITGSSLALAQRPSFGAGWGVGPATRANAEELEPVRDLGEGVSRRKRRLEFGGETSLDLHDGLADAAHEVMVMVVGLALDEFEARGAVAEIVALHESHRLERVHVAVDRGEIAVLLAQRGVDFLVGERVRVAAEDVEDGLSRAGDLAVAVAELLGEIAERLLDEPVRVGVLGAGLVHGAGTGRGEDARRRRARE